MRIGCRAHDFGRRPAGEMADAIAAKGLSCVQLAPFKALTEFGSQAGALTPERASAARQAFEARGVAISVLGCYVNPIHPDLAERRRLLAVFKSHLRVARAFGCGLVALETGSLNADYSPHPANHGEPAFESAVASMAELAEAAEACGVSVGVEAVTAHTVSTPRRMRRLLDLVASGSLRVVFDAANLLDAGNWIRQETLFQEAFELFGERIDVVHAKDFTVEDGTLRLRPMGGGGGLRWEAVFAWLTRHRPQVDVLLEEVGESTVGASLAAVERLMAKS